MTHAMILSPEALATLSQSRNVPLLAIFAVRIAVCVTTWSTRARMRRALSKLDPHQLHDVGITIEQARAEAAHAFWLS